MADEDDYGGSVAPPSKVDTFYFDPNSYASNREPVLSAHEKGFIDFSALVTKDNHTQLFPNFEMPREGMRAPTSFAAKGYAAMYSKLIPIKHFITGEGEDKALRFSHRWEAIVSVLRIPNGAFPEGMKEEHIRKCMESLMNRVAAPAAAAISAVEDHVTKHIFKDDGDACGGSKDSYAWEACLYASGNFVGVYKRKGVAQNEEDEYYIVVNSDAGPVGHSLCGFAIDNPEMTLGEFVASPQMARVKEFSRRNNKRLVARVINALGLDRSMFKLKEDHQAAVDGTKDEAFPDKASGYITKAVYNTFYDPNPAGTSLVYYNSTTRLGTKKYGHAIQLMGLKKGIALYGVKPGGDYRISYLDFVKEGNQVLNTSHDNYFSAWPVSVGSARRKEELPKLSRKAVDSIYSQYMWVDKHKEGAPENYRVTEYRVPDDDRVRFNRFIIGKDYVPERDMVLTPVAVILPPADSKQADQ
jgi:hypothetical protein